MTEPVILATAGYDHKICFCDISGSNSRFIRFPDSQVYQIIINY